MKINDYIEIKGKFWYLQIKITPKSKKNEFFNVLDNKTLKIRIKSPAEKWKANEELISFISQELKIEANKIQIISWKTDKLKLIKIEL
jgi:uncharacterized protein (TIGR00251 family)